MEKDTIWIPVGPQHPFLKEAAKFDFEIRGEEIVGAKYQLGYNHRGMEKACEDRNYYQCLYLLERICGICSHSHTTAFSMAVEQILNLEVPKRGNYLRSMVCELERLHSHLLWIGVAAHEVGFDSLFMLVWRDREVVMELLEAITGNRVNLRHQHHRRRAPRHHGRAAPEGPGHGQGPREAHGVLRPTSAPTSPPSWPASRAWACCPPTRPRPCAPWVPSPGLGPGPGHPQGRSLRGLP